MDCSENSGFKISGSKILGLRVYRVRVKVLGFRIYQVWGLGLVVDRLQHRILRGAAVLGP